MDIFIMKNLTLMLLLAFRVEVFGSDHDASDSEGSENRLTTTVRVVQRGVVNEDGTLTETTLEERVPAVRLLLRLFNGESMSAVVPDTFEQILQNFLDSREEGNEVNVRSEDEINAFFDALRDEGINTLGEIESTLLDLNRERRDGFSEQSSELEARLHRLGVSHAANTVGNNTLHT